jgi:hypothetical protein
MKQQVKNFDTWYRSSVMGNFAAFVFYKAVDWGGANAFEKSQNSE